MTMRRAGWLGVAGVAALYLMSIQSSLAAQRSVATMGQLRASIDEQGWCTDVVRVTVEVPAGAQLSEGSRELQLLTNGVRQILTLECPGLQAMEVTATSAGQVTGRWQHQGDGRLAPLAISASVPQATPSPARPPSPIQVAEIQSLLQALGYQPGPSDGVMGSRTRSAIGAFVVDQRLAMPAQASAELLVQLRLASCGDAAGCRSSGNQTLMNDASTKVALSGELGGGRARHRRWWGSSDQGRASMASLVLTTMGRWLVVMDCHCMRDYQYCPRRARPCPRRRPRRFRAFWTV